VFFGCKPSGEHTEQSTKIYPDTIRQISTKRTVVKPDIYETIDINEIKGLDFLTTTSGVIPLSETKFLCKPDAAGFFGFYSLINKHTNTLFGYLKVYVPESSKAWRFDSDNEYFSSIELVGSDIELLNKFKVGMSEYQLMESLGSSFDRKHEGVVYASFKKYVGSFCIDEARVKKVTVHRFCDRSSSAQVSKNECSAF
jgi:hypothetical protein